MALLHGKEYRLATYLGAKAVKIENGEIMIRQGRFSLRVKQLGLPEHPAADPIPAGSPDARFPHQTYRRCGAANCCTNTSQ